MTAGLVLLQSAVLGALVSLRGSELDVQAQGSAWAARALAFLVVSAFVAVLAAGVGWPLATANSRQAVSAISWRVCCFFSVTLSLEST